MKGNTKTQEASEVSRNRSARYPTNSVTLSFIYWLAGRMNVTKSVIYDLGMQALREKLLERGFSDVPPIDVGDLDLDALIEKTDLQESANKPV